MWHSMSSWCTEETVCGLGTCASSKACAPFHFHSTRKVIQYSFFTRVNAVEAGSTLCYQQ
jgi:hypothetical protein